MNLLLAALRKPISVLVALLAIVFFSVMAILNMKIDIFQTLGLPTIYVAQPYSALSQNKWKDLSHHSLKDSKNSTTE